MANDNDSSSNSNNGHPKNLVQFESQETKHKFGLDKYPDISTEGLVVSLKNILNRMGMDTPSHNSLTDVQYLSLQYWACMCVELLGMRISALHNRIDNCGK
jgi:hypothetical protein